MPTWLQYVIVGVVAYLLGSFSTGLTVARVQHGPNLREVGSKNTGATNVMRTMGLKNGLVTFIGDFLKAALACGIGWWITGNRYGAMLAGILVILGHNWPVFFQFKGGKGVASSCGVLLVCYPIPALICFVLTILLIYLTKYVSLGSMFMLTLFAVITAVTNWGDWLVILWAVTLLALCLLRHRTNIVRLIHGKENKISFGKKKD